MNYNKIQIGWAQTSITPNRPLINGGPIVPAGLPSVPSRSWSRC